MAVDPYRRPKRPVAQPPADIVALESIHDAITAMLAALTSVGPALEQVQHQIASMPAPQVSVQAPNPVIVPPPAVSVEWDTLLDAMAELSRLPEAIAISNDVLPVEVRNRIGLDDETIKALRDAAKATGEVGRVLAAGGSYGPVVSKLEELDDNLEAILAAVGGAVSGKASLLDYDVRTDGNPVYVGTADQGTATSAPDWTVQRLEYDVLNRLTVKQEITDAIWDDRATLGWASY